MFPKPNPAKNTKKATGNCRKSGKFFFCCCSLFYLSCTYISRRYKASANNVYIALISCSLFPSRAMLRPKEEALANIVG